MVLGAQMGNADMITVILDKGALGEKSFGLRRAHAARLLADALANGHNTGWTLARDGRTIWVWAAKHYEGRT